MENNLPNNYPPWPPPVFLFTTERPQGPFAYCPPLYPVYMGLSDGTSIGMPPGGPRVPWPQNPPAMNGFEGVRDFCGQTVDVETSTAATQTSDLVSWAEDLRRPSQSRLRSSSVDILENGRPPCPDSPWNQTPECLRRGDVNVRNINMHGPCHSESVLYIELVDGGLTSSNECSVESQRQEDRVNDADESFEDVNQLPDGTPWAVDESFKDTENRPTVPEPDHASQPMEDANFGEETPAGPSGLPRSDVTGGSYFNIDMHGPHRYEYWGTSKSFASGRHRMEEDIPPCYRSPVRPSDSERPSTSAAVSGNVNVETLLNEEESSVPRFLKRVTPEMLEDALSDLNLFRHNRGLKAKKKPQRRRTRRKHYYYWS